MGLINVLCFYRPTNSRDIRRNVERAIKDPLPRSRRSKSRSEQYNRTTLSGELRLGRNGNRRVRDVVRPAFFDSAYRDRRRNRRINRRSDRRKRRRERQRNRTYRRRGRRYRRRGPRSASLRQACPIPGTLPTFGRSALGTGAIGLGGLGGLLTGIGGLINGIGSGISNILYYGIGWLFLFFKIINR